MVAFPAFLDTCVLYPAYLCDTLLRLAEASAYRPLWSADVFVELRRNLIDRGIPPDRVDRRLGQMSRSFPDALVAGYESLIEGMTNHPKDRHVLAAAVRAPTPRLSSPSISTTSPKRPSSRTTSKRLIPRRDR